MSQPYGTTDARTDFRGNVWQGCRILAETNAGQADVHPENRSSSDGLGWAPGYIGIDVKTFADTYGDVDEGPMDRMVRITLYEYLHLLNYSHYANHRELRTPLDRGLWTMFLEGTGHDISISSRWLPDEQGRSSSAAADALDILEPTFVDRLEKLVSVGSEIERELREGRSMARFDRKWGYLPVASWLHNEAVRCAETETLQTIIGLERDSVLVLALRYPSPEFETRIKAIPEKVGRTTDEETGGADACLAAQRKL